MFCGFDIQWDFNTDLPFHISNKVDKRWLINPAHNIES